MRGYFSTSHLRISHSCITISGFTLLASTGYEPGLSTREDVTDIVISSSLIELVLPGEVVD